LIKRCAFCLLTALFLLSCGIEENYYLPQVPQASIIRISNTEATINIPSISGFYYALYYTIYYRIYISAQDIGAEIQLSNEVLRNVNSQLATDYNYIFPSSDPVNTTATTAANNLFRGRGYYELELNTADIKNILSSGGGKLVIRFPTATGGYPVADINDNQNYRLYRSRDLISPEPDHYFRNTAELSDSAKAIPNINADVSQGGSGSVRHAYVSMYIVAVGQNPTGFTPIYSKPTHISIFKLPNAN
jgi:hypothetical protein